MQPCSSLKLSGMLPMLLLSSSLFLCLCLLPWCSLHSVIFPLSSHFCVPILFSHPAIYLFFLFSSLLSLLSSPSPVMAQRGLATRRSRPALLAAFTAPAAVLGAHSGEQGGLGWLRAAAQRSSIALSTGL